jgi:hypothetical protein
MSAESFSCGALAFRLETTTGMLRDIRYGGREVLRAVYPAVRDSRWGTLAPQITSLERRPGDNRLEILLSARVSADGVDLQWTARIQADANGSLEYRWSGRALGRVETNRTGLCVLHPAELAGCPCVVEHADGTSIAGSFPGPIYPHQPFQNIRAITHALPGGAEVAVRMEGEVFEMEDQRNWTDASFKTYCRPLDWPRPYALEAGAEVEHVARLQVSGRPDAAANRGPVRIASPTAGTPLPRVGFGLPAPVPVELRERLAALRPAHLRVETTAAQLQATMAWSAREAETFGCELHVAILDAPVSPPLRASFPARTVVSLFNAAGNCAEPHVLRAWRDAGFAQVAAGTLHHFAELNRQRPSASAAHTAVTFGINAQVHAFDDTSLFETLTQHAVVARQAHLIGAGRSVCVAPVILGPAADSDDSRLQADFAALWTLGSLAASAHSGCVDTVTFFRTHGPGGILRAGNASPLESVLRENAGASRGSVLPLEPATGSDVQVLDFVSANSRRLLAVNLAEMVVTLEGSPLARPVELAPRSVTTLPLSP